MEMMNFQPPAKQVSSLKYRLSAKDECEKSNAEKHVLTREPSSPSFLTM
jgi:hypothetical protein